MQQTILSILVTNRFGVLAKITAMFGRRGCNIDSLTVCTAGEPEHSRITVTMRDTEYKTNQILNQIEKLEDVLEVAVLSGDNHVERTFALIRLKKGVVVERKNYEDDELYMRAGTLDDGSQLVEAYGPTQRIDALIDQLKALGVDRIGLSGCTALKVTD